MTKCILKLAVDKTYANVVAYFNKREAEIEDFKVSQPNTAKQHGFASVDTVRKLAIDTLLERLLKRDEVKVAAAIEVNNKIKKLREVLLNINKNLDRAETRTTQQRKPTK